MKLTELAFACYVYAHMTGFENAYLRLLEDTTPRLDLRQRLHRLRLLKWLNDWGCRQFAKDHHELAAEEIGRWYGEIGDRLFSSDKTLLALSPDDFAVAEDAYAKLMVRTASRRKLANGGEARVTIGPTGAAKILFALRPNALVHLQAA